MAGQTFIYHTSALFISLPWPFEAPKASHHTLSSGCLTYMHGPSLLLNLFCMWGLWSSHVCQIPYIYMYWTWLFSLASLCHVHVIIRPTRRTWRIEESLFLPHSRKPAKAKCGNIWSDVCLPVILDELPFSKGREEENWEKLNLERPSVEKNLRPNNIQFILDLPYLSTLSSLHPVLPILHHIHIGFCLVRVLEN